MNNRGESNQQTAIVPPSQLKKGSEPVTEMEYLKYSSELHQ